MATPKTQTWLYSKDPALRPAPGLDEKGLSDWKELVTKHFARRDQEAVKLCPTAVRFEVAEIPAWFEVFYLDAPQLCPHDSARSAKAFLAAVQSVHIPGREPLTPLDADGTDSRQVHRGEGGQTVMVAPLSWLQKLRSAVGMDAVYEIGKAAIIRSHLAEGDDLPFG